MWMNGSRSARSTPANARRTGNPSPSKPCGAVVTDRTVRSRAPGDGADRWGNVVGSAVTAGIGFVLQIVAATSIPALPTDHSLAVRCVDGSPRRVHGPDGEVAE